MSISVEDWNDFYLTKSISYATGVVEFSKDDFLNLCSTNLLKLVNTIKNGKVVVIRSFYSHEQIKTMHSICSIIENDCIEGFYPMLDNSPDHMRKIAFANDKYAFRSERTSYFFYRWNAQKNHEKRLIWEQLDLLWDKVKILSGHPTEAFKSNIPSTGPVDRGQIIIYEAECGEMEAHTDPSHTQRIIAGVEFTERGVNYGAGGFYVYSSHNTRMDIQAITKPGDAVFCLANIPHGVSKIKQISQNFTDPINFLNKRIYLGLYTNDSDRIENRRTSTPFMPK